MPRNIINEIDNTTAGTLTYENFAVLIPGFVETNKAGDVFDENGVFECTKSNLKTFEEKIGTKDNQDGEENQRGRFLAYQLLKLGYTVLFKKLDATTEYGAGKKKGVAAMETTEFWEPLKDKSVYDFRYICLGDIVNADAIEKAKDLATFLDRLHVSVDKVDELNATGRGECFLLTDIDESGLSATARTQSDYIKHAKEKLKTLDNKLNKYVAVFAPRVYYAGDTTSYPASFHYLASAARAFTLRNEWWAVSGYQRGFCDKTVDHTSVKLGEIAVNALQPRTIVKDGNTTDLRYAVNIVRTTRDGHYIWGNRTAETLNETGLVASHFLNIRQLCCTLKKELNRQCDRHAYNPNSDILWAQFCASIKPLLEKMKTDEGIKDYKLIKVTNDKKGLLTAAIKIVPIEAVEDFHINVYLEDSIAGVVANIEEDFR